MCHSFKTSFPDQMLDELESIHQQMPYQSDVLESMVVELHVVSPALLNAKKVTPIIESHADVHRHSIITYGNYVVAYILLLVNMRKTTKSHSCQDFNDQQVAISFV